MSIRKVSFIQEEFFHVYNRGNSKQVIFKDKYDYDRFVKLLYAVNRKEKFNFSDSLKGISVYELPVDAPLVAIGAYCLMSNHFHLLLTPLTEKGLSLFMQKLSTAYVMYFNQKYKRTGGLFEGKFKSQHAASDRHLQYLFSYIHLNPIRQKKEDTTPKDRVQFKNEPLKYLQQYPYSSFLDYIGQKRVENCIINSKAYPQYFKKFDSKTFIKELQQWIKYDS